jgi:AcrR family transcriptional regulator
LLAAADLFHARGVAATSPDDVIEASGTGKGQLYHYFRNKEGLVHAVLQNYVDEIRAGLNPASFEITNRQDLERWFLAHLELQQSYRMKRGCPFGTIGNGVTEQDELVRQDLVLIFELMKNNLAAYFIKERSSGRLSPGADEEQLAEFCIASIQGAMLLGKLQRSPHAVESTIAAAMTYINSQFL